MTRLCVHIDTFNAELATVRESWAPKRGVIHLLHSSENALALPSKGFSVDSAGRRTCSAKSHGPLLQRRRRHRFVFTTVCVFIFSFSRGAKWKKKNCNLPEIFVVGSDEKGEVRLLVVGLPVVLVVFVVMVVLVGTLTGDTLTFGETGQLQRLAVVSSRISTGLQLQGGQ